MQRVQGFLFHGKRLLLQIIVVLNLDLQRWLLSDQC